MRGSRTAGACGLVEARRRRRAATRYPAPSRWSERVAACAAPLLVVPPLLLSAAAALYAQDRPHAVSRVPHAYGPPALPSRAQQPPAPQALALPLLKERPQ